MKKKLLLTANIRNIEKELITFSNDKNVQSVLLLACDENNWNIPELDSFLQNLNIPIFGGIFPQIIYGEKSYTRGMILLGLPYEPEIHVFDHLSSDDKYIEKEFKNLYNSWGNTTSLDHTFLTFIDGMSTKIEHYVKNLFYHFGLEQNFIGGGAGSLSFVQKPCIITPKGVLSDAAILINLPTASGIGVSHGWEIISESIKVTESDQNIIKSLNWQPASYVYKKLIGQYSGEEIDDSKFFDVSKKYPLGIKKLANEVVVRDPIQINEDQSLTCVGEVPKGSFVHLLHGEPENLIDAAGIAHKKATEVFSKTNNLNSFTFFIDCISRALFLEDEIQKELNIVSDDNEMIGVFSLGEIANNGESFLEFYNKTAVVGKFNIPE